jgi:hypothetical protein
MKNGSRLPHGYIFIPTAASSFSVREIAQGSLSLL